VTDPLGRLTRFGYDSSGRVTQQTLPDGRAILFGYDANGNLTSLTPPGRSAHGFQYTPVNLTAQYDPPGIPGPTPTRYFYNRDRQLDSIVRPDSITIGFRYDTAGRPRTVTFDRGTLSFGYSGVTGHLVAIRAPSGDSLAFRYDGFLPTQVRWAGTVNGSVEVAYNRDFRIASQTVNGADAVTFTYDRDGLLTGAGALRLGRSATNGLVLSDTLGPVVSAYRYTSRAELQGYRVTAQGTPLFATGYVRDSLGRITQLFDTTQGTPTRWSFVYDSVGRLAADSLNGTIFHVFTYDANGNRSSYTASNGSINYSYDAQDRLLAAGTTTYTYGSNGELRTKTVPGVGTTTYTYDALGNLITVVLPSGTRIDYVIDGHNRRVGRKLNGVLVQGWLYQNRLNPVAELDGVGRVVSRFVYGKRVAVPDYVIKNGIAYRIIADHLGSVRLVVDTATGAVAQRIDYDEWGNLIQNTNPGFQPFGFAGGMLDDSTNLVRFGARDYDPLVGRWATKDPVGFAGRDANLYGYAFNDPVNFIDPSGLECQKSFIERAWDNFAATNEILPGVLAPPLLGLLTAGKVAEATGGLTVLQWLKLGFGGARLGAATFTAVETGVVVAGTTLLNWALVSAAFESGVAIGSLINAAIEPCEERAPREEQDSRQKTPPGCPTAAQP
jgi:RHS repeat-associated protein